MHPERLWLWLCLQSEVSVLRGEVAQLKTLLLAHQDCPITLQQKSQGQLALHTSESGCRPLCLSSSVCPPQSIHLSIHLSVRLSPSICPPLCLSTSLPLSAPLYVRGAGMAQWLSARLVIEWFLIRIHAGAVGEFSSPGSTFCADSFISVSVPLLCYRSSM